MSLKTEKLIYRLWACGVVAKFNPTRWLCDKASREMDRQRREILRLRKRNATLRAKLVRP